MKIKEYPQISALQPTDIFILDGPSGTRNIRAADLGRALLEVEDAQEIANFIDMGKLSAASGLNREDKIMVGIDGNGNKAMKLADFFWELFNAAYTPDKAEMKKCLYRGKHLGNVVEDWVWDELSSGDIDRSIRNLFIGDYWIIGGVKYVIADFDYWWNYGDGGIDNRSHAVIVPDPLTSIGALPMNDTATTTGGYKSTKMFNEFLPERILPILESAFGSTHIYPHKDLISSAVSSDGIANSVIFTAVKLNIPNQIEVYGSSRINRSEQLQDSVLGQLALFRLSSNYYVFYKRIPYWLRDVYSTSSFAMVNSNGMADAGSAAGDRYVRPIFGICASNA